MTKKKLNYKEALSKLEVIVNKLEDTDITLDDSLLLYKEGIELSDFLNDYLSCAEKEVLILQKNSSGKFKENHFGSEETDESFEE